MALGAESAAIDIARSCIRSGARGRFYNMVDLVNRLETETRAWTASSSSTTNCLFGENYSAAGASLTEISQTGCGLRIRLDFCRKARIAVGVGRGLGHPPAR
jgi:hypothetical protein